MLAGLLALHSSAGVHAYVGVALTHTEHAAAGELNSGLEGTNGSPSQLLVCDAECLLECALVVLVCLSLLILTAAIFIRRIRAVFVRLLDRGPGVIGVGRDAVSHVYQPSLSVLSVLRV